MEDKLGRFKDKDYSELLQENVRLKEELYKATKPSLKMTEINKKFDKYKQALAEIKEIAEKQMRCCTCKLDDYKSGCKECETNMQEDMKHILQKISEVE